MSGGTITVYESHDGEGDMLFTVTVQTYSNSLIDELRRLAGPGTKFVYHPDVSLGGPTMLDSDEVAYIENGPAPKPALPDRLMQVVKEAREQGEDVPDTWRDLFPAGWEG